MQQKVSHPVRIGTVVGLIALCVVMLVNALLRYRATQQLLDANRQIEHTLAVEAQLENIGALLRDAETGQRGYLLTGQESYLQPYEVATQQLPAAMQRLGGMVADNPEQVKNVERLQNLTTSKLAELRNTVERYRQGHPDAARDLIQSNLGKRFMDEIRSTLANMDQIERNLLAQRKQSLKDVEFKEDVGLATGLFIGMLALIAFGWALDRIEIVRQRSTAALIESEEWLSTTLSSIGDAVIATDRDGSVRFLNPVAQRVTQCSQENAQGRPLREVFPIFNELTRQPAENPVDKVLATGLVVGLANHTVLVRPDGSEVAIDDSAAPILDRAGEVVGVVLVFRDVSHQREIEKAMRISEKLAAAGKLAATVAHEINNPLEAASNLLYLLRDEVLSPDGRDYLKMAEEQMLRVSHIARQTLAFYRDPRHPAPLVLNAVCGRILELYRPRLANKKLHVSAEYAQEVVVFGTEGELTQVISNLISNAIDAVNYEGTVTVKVATGSDGKGFLSVSDDGSGIAPENIGKIFEPFFTTKKDVGTGLGLWVSKEIVEKLGGSITVRSAGKGQGATFSVTLPLYAREQSSTPVSAVPRQSLDAG